jgi:hypothetical protein
MQTYINKRAYVFKLNHITKYLDAFSHEERMPGESFPGAGVRVVSNREGSLQAGQLPLREDGSVPPLPPSAAARAANNVCWVASRWYVYQLLIKYDYKKSGIRKKCVIKKW